MRSARVGNLLMSESAMGSRPYVGCREADLVGGAVHHLVLLGEPSLRVGVDLTGVAEQAVAVDHRPPGVCPGSVAIDFGMMQMKLAVQVPFCFGFPFESRL